MKKLLLLLILFSQVAIGQRLKKQEKSIIEDLKTTITFLSSDKLEGRRTGSPGEMLAANYLAAEFKKAGLSPKGENNSYIQGFLINEGKQILPETFLTVNGDSLKIGQDFFPMSFSASGTEEAFASPAFQEKGMPWFLDIKEMLDQSSQNPHFDLRQAIKKMLMESVQKGATSLIVFNSGNTVSDLQFDGKSTADSVNVPVVFITKNVADKYLKDASSNLDIKMKIAIGAKTREGHNVIGFIDNGAANTIIIGAHYDHLGWGDDQNSLTNAKAEIYNGADDNASGTAAVLQLAKLLKDSKLKNNNYLFICFSGEELGLFGSKYFTSHPTIDLATVNYMINCDMIGRLNDDTKNISVGGFGTSPVWGKILPSRTKSLNVKFDSSGIGPSDHTSFYLKNIPVLFFFTGTHPDYHKPTDDADKINYTGELRVIQYIYDVISETNKSGKISFSKTRDQQMNGPQFSVTLGILPDYTSSENGLRIDAIIKGKIAEDAGMKAGDIIKALGDYKVSDINSYMAALSKFKKGDATKVIILRGKDTKTFDIIF
jgi:Zn-dependent M28 family amino/carboxypeptidase